KDAPCAPNAFIMRQPRAVDWLAVQLRRLDVEVRCGGPRRLDYKAAAMLQVDHAAAEDWRADVVERLAGVGEQPDRGPHIPGRKRPGVVIARQSRAAAVVIFRHDSADPLGGPIRTARVDVEPGRKDVR